MSEESRRVCFVSGHMDLTPEEFREHYVPFLHTHIQAGCTFVVGDAPGCDQMTWLWFTDAYPLGGCPLVIYHMLTAPRPCPAWEAGWFPVGEVFPLVGGFTSDEARDAAMTEASDFDLAWVRPGKRKNNGTQKNIDRRQVQRRVRDRAQRRELAATWPKVYIVEFWHDNSPAPQLRIRSEKHRDHEPVKAIPVDPVLVQRYHTAAENLKHAEDAFAGIQQELRQSIADHEDLSRED